MGAPSLDASLDVSSTERVALALPIAGVGSRALAWLVDAGLLLLAWVALYFLASLLSSDLLGIFQGLSALGRTLLLVGAFAAQWLYWTGCEVLLRGQTPGKRLAGIRVVLLDGSAVGPLESAVRNLLRLVDFLPLGYALGGLTSLLTGQHRRLGDLAAGTVLIRAEQISLAHYVTAVPTVPGAGPVRLEHAELDLLCRFLDRAPQLVPEARTRLGRAFLARHGGGLADAERAHLAASPPALEAWLGALARGER
jgi:uncharacterized RDD family membrane protein YckC